MFFDEICRQRGVGLEPLAEWLAALKFSKKLEKRPFAEPIDAPRQMSQALTRKGRRLRLSSSATRGWLGLPYGASAVILGGHVGASRWPARNGLLELESESDGRFLAAAPVLFSVVSFWSRSAQRVAINSQPQPQPSEEIFLSGPRV